MIQSINTQASRDAANILVDGRLTGTQGERLPEHCRPTNLEQALAIQDAVTELWCESQDDSIGGWKCLLPPEGRVIVAPIYTRNIDSIPPVALWPKGKNSPDDQTARIEPEFAFFLGQDLPPRDQPYTAADVDAAISRTHMALELIHCRYAQPSQCEFPEMLADCLVNQGLFIGPQVDNQLAANAAEMTIKLQQNGETQSFNGKHPNGNPRAPLYWLAEFLRQRGQGLVAGQAIITGSFAGVFDVAMDTPLVIDYEGIGQLQVSFTAKRV